jgi:putative transposase
MSSLFGHQVLDEGMRVSWFSRKGEIETVNANVGFIVIQFENNELEMHKIPEVYQALASGKLVIEKAIKSIVIDNIKTPEQVALYQQKQDYIEYLDAQENPRSRKTMQKIIPLVAKMRGEPVKTISDSTLYRWYSEYLKNGRNIAAMVVKPKVKRRSKFDGNALDFFDDVVWDEYMKFNGPKAEGTYEVYAERHHNLSEADKKKISPIGRTRFLEMIKELEFMEVTRARKGDDAARILAKTREHLFFADHPLQRVEVDAVHINIGLLDRTGKEYVGMPIVYLAIDVYTRAIVGFYVAFGETDSKTNGLKRSENSSHVRALLEHVLFKAEESAVAQSPWPLMGPPADVVCDVGAAFNNKEVENFIAAFKGNHVLTQAGSPWKKPFVERFNRTLRDHFARKLGSYVGRRVNQEVGNINVREISKYTIEQFKELLEIFILDIYHQRKHKGLGGRTPFNVAKELNYKRMYEVPLSIADIASRMGVKYERKLQPNGDIVFDKLTYNSVDTQMLYRELSARSKKNFKVDILVRNDDISNISIVNPLTNTAIVVPSLDVHFSISRAEHKADPIEPIVKDKINPNLANNKRAMEIMGDAQKSKDASVKANKVKAPKREHSPEARGLNQDDISAMKELGGGKGTQTHKTEDEELPQTSRAGLERKTYL